MRDKWDLGRLNPGGEWLEVGAEHRKTIGEADHVPGLGGDRSGKRPAEQVSATAGLYGYLGRPDRVAPQELHDDTDGRASRKCEALSDGSLAKVHWRLPSDRSVGQDDPCPYELVAGGRGQHQFRLCGPELCAEEPPETRVGGNGCGWASKLQLLDPELGKRDIAAGQDRIDARALCELYERSVASRQPADRNEEFLGNRHDDLSTERIELTFLKGELVKRDPLVGTGLQRIKAVDDRSVTGEALEAAHDADVRLPCWN